ncbi:hypothetical protein AB205_0166360, partial [Aquarana catesbeiana]
MLRSRTSEVSLDWTGDVSEEGIGRENVVVVIDDMEDTSEVQKNAILKDQSSIGTLARDLLLFENDDKKMAKVSETGKSHQQLRGIIKDHDRRL